MSERLHFQPFPVDWIPKKWYELVGGWTPNPIEKYFVVKIGSSSPNSDENKKWFETTPGTWRCPLFWLQNQVFSNQNKGHLGFYGKYDRIVILKICWVILAISRFCLDNAKNYNYSFPKLKLHKAPFHNANGSPLVADHIDCRPW